MTDLNGIENLNIFPQEKGTPAEETFPNLEVANSEQEETSVIKQETPEKVSATQETNEIPVKNSSKPSTGYTLPQTPDDEVRLVLLFAKMINERIPVSQD